MNILAHYSVVRREESLQRPSKDEQSVLYRLWLAPKGDVSGNIEVHVPKSTYEANPVGSVFILTKE